MEGQGTSVSGNIFSKVRSQANEQSSLYVYSNTYSYDSLAYNVRLTAQNQIVVNVGKRDKPIYLPAEVCQVVSGQVAHQKLSSRQTSAMIKIACRPPPSNANEIVKDGLSIMGIRGAVGNQGLVCQITLLLFLI